MRVYARLYLGIVTPIPPVSGQWGHNIQRLLLLAACNCKLCKQRCFFLITVFLNALKKMQTIQSPPPPSFYCISFLSSLFPLLPTPVDCIQSILNAMTLKFFLPQLPAQKSSPLSFLMLPCWSAAVVNKPFNFLHS